MRTSALVSVLIVLLAGPALADEVLEDSWHRVHLAGVPSGFTHAVVRRIETDEGPRIETTAHTEMRINRLGSTIEVVSTEVTRETPEGALLWIESKTTTSGQEQVSRFEFDGRDVTLFLTVLGQTRESRIEVPEGVLGPYAIERRTAELVGKTDEAVELFSFLVDVANSVRTTVTAKGLESVALLDGATAKLTRVESALEGLPMKPIAWLDDAGKTQKTELRVAGMVFETYAVADEAAAKRAPTETATPLPDVFEATLIREPGPVPAPRRLQAAVIEMRPATDDAALPEIASEAHTVIVAPDGSRVIYARRSEPPGWLRASRPLVDPPEELAKALAPNSMIQSDAEEIRKVAQEIVGDETDAWRAAQALERWVYVNLTNKGFGVAFASALEVFRNREGDCTEHAVLLAALCRAAGIPARVVMGVEYLMGIWGGHAWNEVWIDSEWYALDATNGYGFADPLHLPMAHLTLEDTGFLQEFGALLGGLGNLALDVVEVTHAGRRIQVNDPALVQIDGDRYVNRVWGVAFSAPEGFAFDPPTRRGISASLMGLDGSTAGGEMCEIEIAAMDVPAGGTWEAILASLGLAEAGVQEAEVDGRPARRYVLMKDGRIRTRAGVLAGDVLFLFEMDRVEGDAERAAFESFLSSVDFDVR